jgi:hypothetical protein
MSDNPDIQLYAILDRAVHSKPEEVADICRDLQDCIDHGGNLYGDHHLWRIPLWQAIEGHAPIDVIRVLYTNTPAAKNIQGLATSYGESEFRTVTYLLTFEGMLSQRYGRYFRNMFDTDIPTIEYVLTVLEVLEMTETDVDWDAYLKLGLCD